MESNDKNEKQRLIHDIRSPIAVISGFLKAIRDLPMNDEQKEYYEAAVRSGEKVKDLVNKE